MTTTASKVTVVLVNNVHLIFDTNLNCVGDTTKCYNDILHEEDFASIPICTSAIESASL